MVYHKTKNLILYAFFAALLAVSAVVKIPAPFVPVTLQTLFVLLSGFLLGKNGAFSVLLYLAVGLCGLPVFSGGGGIAYVFYPTFGYLLGFVFAAFVVGILSKNENKSVLRLFVIGLLGLLVIYLFGSIYFLGCSKWFLGKDVALSSFMLSFLLIPLPLDLLSAFGAAYLAKRLKPILQ